MTFAVAAALLLLALWIAALVRGAWELFEMVIEIWEWWRVKR